MKNKIEFIFQAPDKSPGYLLHQVHLLWQRKIKTVLDPLDLTHTQFVLLASIAWLTNQREDITQVEIAELNHYDRMMVSKVLRTLETKKLIERQQHRTDTRAKVVMLTAQGRKLLQKALTRVEEMDVDFFAGIDNKMAEFNSQLQGLIDANKEE